MSLRGVPNLFLILMILMSFFSYIFFNLLKTSMIPNLVPMNRLLSKSLTSQLIRSTPFLFFFYIFYLKLVNSVIKYTSFSTARNSMNLEIYFAYLIVFISFWFISGMSVFFVSIFAKLSLKLAKAFCWSSCCFLYFFDPGSSADVKEDMMELFPVYNGK